MPDCLAEPDDCQTRPLTYADLVESLAVGCKPAAQHRIGSEHEKLIFHRADLRRPAYDGADGVHALLEGLEPNGWSPVIEHNRHGAMLIGLSRAGANVSLEPGGQFELSGAPFSDMHAIAAETQSHLDEVKAVGDRLGLGFLALGHDPLWTRADVPVMPKGRYDIMRAYMPKVGGLGLDMMLRTCTVQANLDFASEADMADKFRLSLALQPLATALWANSPFVEGKPTGWLSTRARVWTDTDPDRTGLLAFVFEPGFGFARYVDYALDVPMYFVKRGGQYVDVSGRSFRQFMDHGLPELPGDRPSLKDWADHLTTAFPEVRLKTYLEMRGSDVGKKPMLDALPAFWGALLYDDAARAAAWELVKGWTREDREALRLDAARLGLKAQVAGRPLKDVAKDVLAIADQALARRGQDEAGFLNPLHAIADSGLTNADRLLQRFHGPWAGDVRKVYEEEAY
jgi:glutamate--cysteine ligase